MSDYAGHLTTVANGSQWLTCRVQYLDDTDPFSSTNFPEPTRPPSYTFNVDLPLCEQLAGVHRLLKAPHKIDDCTLQISSSGSYLDLDLSISEQKEEFDNFFTDGKRNSVIVRTQLSVRVHSCIEKLYNSKGRELRRALFSLKQIFQDDKDLVHEFVNANGLTCLIKVGAEADQNYQNYILRALGQIMLYVDGMNGVIEHKETVRWLYTLIASRFRLVVKTTLKLLLVFVEYVETNALSLLDALRTVDSQRRQKPWTNVMKVLDEKDGIDSELLVYAMTLVNKTLSNIPDQDTFYDITDALEALGMEVISQRHLSKQGTELDLVEQFRIYELALKHEDGDEDVSGSSTPGLAIKWNRERKKSELAVDRKSVRRHSANLSQLAEQPALENAEAEKASETSRSTPSTPARQAKSAQEVTPAQEVTQVNRRSRARNLQQQHLDMQRGRASVSELVAGKNEDTKKETPKTDPTTSPKPWLMRKSQSEEKSKILNTVRYGNAVAANTEDHEQKRRQRDQTRDKRRNEPSNMPNGLPSGNAASQQSAPPPPPTRTSKSKVLESARAKRLAQKSEQPAPRSEPAKDITAELPGRGKPETETATSRLKIGNGAKPVPKIEVLRDSETKPVVSSTPSVPLTPSDVISTKQKLMMDMLYSNQAVKEIRESESDEASGDDAEKDDSKSGPADAAKTAFEKILAGQIAAKGATPGDAPAAPAPVKSPVAEQPAIPKKDSDIMWEKLLEQSAQQSLKVSDFDFTDLTSADDVDIISKFTAPPPTIKAPSGSGPPPPPPPPPVPGAPPPPPPMAPPPPPAAPVPNAQTPKSQPSKKQRTVRLFWKEVKEASPKSFRKPSTVWENIEDVAINEAKISHLFELRTKDVVKKQQVDKKNRITVLDPKRSNAINIGLTVLPPPRTIKSAILHMDEFTLHKEQIDKLLAMIPTEEETARIQDAMQENPDVPLGNAEQFMLTLSSVSELRARLHLWSFKLDYEIQEKEIAEPLIDLRDGVKQLRNDKTFRGILAVLKGIGNFLNGSKAKGFDVRYLSKVPEVKDTVHKQSLLHHLTQMVLEHFPNSTDFYSGIGSVTRASKVDFVLLEETLASLEVRCKAAWDHLKTIARHETKAQQRNKMSDFLLTAGRRIITLGVVHKRLLNRFHETLVFFGLSPREAVDTTPSSFCRMISEFALEYRTARERALTQQMKRQKRGERNKTRGKMITEGEILSDSSEPESVDHHVTRKFSQTEEQIKQKQMEMALGQGDDSVVQTTTRRRQRGRNSKGNDEASPAIPNGHAHNADSTSPRKEPLDITSSVRRRGSRKIVDDHSDETIMDQLVKAATQTPHERQRRRRARNSSRKSLRRTLKHGLTDEEKAVIMGSI